jgi:hypothetical protein
MLADSRNLLGVSVLAIDLGKIVKSRNKFREAIQAECGFSSALAVFVPTQAAPASPGVLRNQRADLYTIIVNIVAI